MSCSNVALPGALPAPNMDSVGAEARLGVVIPAAECAVPAKQVRRTDEPTLLHSGGGADAVSEDLRNPACGLMSPRSVRPAACGEPRYAPGTPVARIYQRERSPMQSGQARESTWQLTFEPKYRTEIDFLMGWTSSRDTLQQVELRFHSLDEAVAFAKRRKLQYVVETPRRRKVQPKSYADNFRHDRLLHWTH